MNRANGDSPALFSAFIRLGTSSIHIIAEIFRLKISESPWPRGYPKGMDE